MMGKRIVGFLLLAVPALADEAPDPKRARLDRIDAEVRTLERLFQSHTGGGDILVRDVSVDALVEFVYRKNGGTTRFMWEESMIHLKSEVVEASVPVSDRPLTPSGWFPLLRTILLEQHVAVFPMRTSANTFWLIRRICRADGGAARASCGRPACLLSGGLR